MEKEETWIHKHPVLTVVGGILALLIVLGFIRSLIGNPVPTGDVINNQEIEDTTQSSSAISKTETNQETNPPATFETWHKVISLSGKGNEDTESFHIKGKKVKITATTCCGIENEYGSVGTFSGISLESEEGGYIGTGLSIMTEGTEEGHGETIYRNLDAGEYYISVITGVEWEVEVEDYY